MPIGNERDDGEREKKAEDGDAKVPSSSLIDGYLPIYHERLGERGSQREHLFSELQRERGVVDVRPGNHIPETPQR